MYNDPWLRYMMIPAENMERWFQKWALKFIWDVEHNLIIKKIYDHRIAKSIQQMMSDVRQRRNHLTRWILTSIKKELEAHFRNNEGFKHHLLMNVANTALPRSSKYTGGLTTFIKTKSRLPNSFDREATLVETFNYTYILKANKERFANERSAAHYEDYMQRLEVATQQSQLHNGNNEAGSKTLMVDLDRVWRKTASKLHKNHRFRLGSFFTSCLRSSVLAAFSDFATSLTDLRKLST
ncbi:hypothetical protein Ahy_A03g015275 isoform A [Arachis hypogaea]|uniref:Uncharacterized protein n=1 Tax=Arachis hypogaea TaxID=3818 RepID=A0A445E0B0_ARAHY|nr:hypothetical protein Ahy_A03g015275 isoform A [Arachis hypogaea]